MDKLSKIPTWVIGLVLTAVGCACGYSVLQYEVEQQKTKSEKMQSRLEKIDEFKTSTLILLDNIEKTTSKSSELMHELKEEFISYAEKIESHRKSIADHSKEIAKILRKQDEMMKEIRTEFLTKEVFNQEKEKIHQRFAYQKEQIKEKK